MKINKAPNLQLGGDVTTVKSPGVVKFFGEHAIVEGKFALAMAIDRYASADISNDGGDLLTINLPDLGESRQFSREDLVLLYRDYKAKETVPKTNRNDYIAAFVSRHQDIGINMLPLAVIAARLLYTYNAAVLGRTVTVNSNIPMQRGLASSAACSTAFTVCLLRACNLNLEDSQIIDIARDGERVRHTSEGGGKIDVSTSYYGGFVSYSDSTGAKKEHIEADVKLLTIDTGSKKPTSDMVRHFKERLVELGDKSEEVLNLFDKCSRDGFKALCDSNMKAVGNFMYKNQELLKYMEMSSEGLDEVVAIARENGAYGCKLSGGGGGGIAIALTDDPKRLGAVFASKGYDSYIFNKSAYGTK
ncbi:MAG: mevalonate kinase [Candidatus Micrarchaeaceae archaeon]